jgi:hypothetical protein
MLIRARRFIRKMRGGAQAHLIEGADGEFYVVKFANNPQHRRILVNEWLAAGFLRYLQIFAPETVLIEISDGFVKENPGVGMTLGTRKTLPEPGLHFGSRVAVNPDRTAIYDFLPDTLLVKVENRLDFLGALVFDKWVSNADSRQAIFFRARARRWTPLRGDAPERKGFFAQMIDHGFAFSGPRWEFEDSPIQGLYFRSGVYDEVRSLESFQPWLDLVRHFPEEVIDEAWKQIPREWYQSDQSEIEALLEQLLKRRQRIDQLLMDAHKARGSAFANWR